MFFFKKKEQTKDKPQVIPGFETWECHVCGEERPDEKISVFTKPLIINNACVGEQNIRYCNDKAECIEGARHKDFFNRSCKASQKKLGNRNSEASQVE